MDKDRKTQWSYDPVANIYEKIAYIYSFGLIKKAKLSQLSEIRPKDKVLYVGVGSGEDAVCAAMAGADITCLDISQKMIDRTKKRFAKHNLKAVFVCDDVTKYSANNYDVVVANFFLNNFTQKTMQLMLSHLARLVKPGGKLLIADFKSPSGSILSRLLQAFNFSVAVLFFWALGVAPLHKMLDYKQHFMNNGLVVGNIKPFKFLSLGPILYESITAAKTM